VNQQPIRIALAAALVALAALLFLGAGGAAAQPFPVPTDAERALCTFTTAGNNPFFPLIPGYALHLEGEEDGAEIASINTVLHDVEQVDGVLTRVYEERESEDGELVEVSRNFFAICRETGDMWYFGEDVDDYEDGEIVGHGGAWRAGIAGARPGIVMLGAPKLGARYAEESAPGVAEDQAEIIGVHGSATVPAGTFEDVLSVQDSDAATGELGDVKKYAHGVGNIVDGSLELVEITEPGCTPDGTTHCLQNGRFRVRAEWQDFFDNSGEGQAILASADSGEFWFFDGSNTELLVKVLNACGLPQFESFWVFASGLTNVAVTLTVEDTESDEVRVYSTAIGEAFGPILDTAAFATCP
jgi:hypothetical protein